jgi:hypothetical protein
LGDEIKKLVARINTMEISVSDPGPPTKQDTVKQESKSEQTAQNPMSVETSPEGIETKLAERMPDEVKRALEKASVLTSFLSNYRNETT